jgi:hypothetical protein
MRLSFLPGTTVLLLAATSLAHAQGESPMRRAHHALVYDGKSERVLLVGGSTPLDGGNSYRFFDDVWALEAGGWKQLHTSGAGRSGERLAYDAKSKTIVSLGGFDGTQPLGDVRVFDGRAWQAMPSLTQRPVAEGGIAYDSKRDVLVAFGGWGGRDRTHGDTWQFANGAWTVFAGNNPPARQAFAMTYDGARNESVVFGGFGKDPTELFGDTWTFDGRTWKQAATTGPAARHSAGYTFDSKRGRVLLFGGYTKDGQSNELWSWDGKGWTLLAQDGPEARGMGQLAYDAKRDRVVLFGGRKGFPDGDLADTWEWDGTKWTRRRENQ